MKLNYTQVKSLLALQSEMTMVELAQHFGITRQTVAATIKRYAHEFTIVHTPLVFGNDRLDPALRMIEEIRGKSSINLEDAHNKETFIYLLRCGEFHKIGLTCKKNLKNRLGQYYVHCPFEIIVVSKKLTTYANSMNYEKSISIEFADKVHRKNRIKSEWYLFSEEDVIKIKNDWFGDDEQGI